MKLQSFETFDYIDFNYQGLRIVPLAIIDLDYKCSPISCLAIFLNLQKINTFSKLNNVDTLILLYNSFLFLAIVALLITSISLTVGPVDKVCLI